MYNMEMEFKVAGGTLIMDKKAFVLEMLSKDSRLRTLLNWKTNGGFAEQHPAVKKTDSSQVIIDFSYITDVVLGETWSDVLGELKSKYKDKIKGRVACHANYWGTLTSFEIDLNSDDGTIQFIKNQ